MLDLWHLRRLLLPIAEGLDKAHFGNEYKFAFPAQDVEYAGTVEKPPGEVRAILKGMDDVYPNNLAAAKFIEREDESVVYDIGSYAHRPEGFMGDYQTHVRLFESEDGTDIYAHYEYNPWAHPRKHYNGAEWSAKTGVSRAKQLLSDHIET